MKIKGRMPKVIEREPWDLPGESRLPMYMESDSDYMDKNRWACIWFLDNHKAIRKLIKKFK